MRGKGNQNQDEEEYEDVDFSSRKHGTSSNHTSSNSNSNAQRDGKNCDKANAIRSKHSVTEQRRRSKINERFQILRDLIPHNDQKKDTASFLLEVIEYVHYLQEKVQKYEASYQGWGSEPSKLLPWRNSHWRVQSFVGHPQATKNGSGLGPMFAGKFDENNITLNPTTVTNAQNAVESDLSRNVACKAIEPQPELANKGMPLPLQLQTNVPGLVQNDVVAAHPIHGLVSETQPSECPITSDTLNQQEELTIEGGTISISSVYSEGLLNNLTQALQSVGIDLSQALLTVQINLGKRANRDLTSGSSTLKDPLSTPCSNQAVMHLRDASSGEDSDQAQKRLKT